ncbi:hypothetical protein COCC4DRAFT_34124 [Bipolaris maydis ATCC 48331]|uniref:Uncharacterized protein n=2 Tax=Cochliobolus heterostrophus TaxID=5016 RepID=M2U795_COCH5|nr:uncharacterized protein COCC4DRAFT_34124 [Bipolaris maydis ATCC 48331]EMD94364.1 hypothetical protein COCHEDRAFT_1192461 [Bipolaris maydis C5]KAJ5026479.1 hypothetical protein J3E73DRAFT_306310 [Bipolaris maydis]ENI01297.1 hypothetical protein COCC4DRAFT_34124 [Bipolaris maydis ATCC 48331]KAJ6271236.1 hypothetical protein PSV08DRAFT_292135 [Bipolaris maydis]KAJ6282717.1 hypothetical protein J3E71DRAFT_288446 [Bipolaris maydis]
MKPLNSPILSHQSIPELLPSPGTKSCSQKAEVFTQSETSPAHLISTSKTPLNPNSNRVSIQQLSQIPNVKRDSTKASDLAVLPFPSTCTLPPPTRFTKYMKTMKSKSQ